MDIVLPTGVDGVAATKTIRRYERENSLEPVVIFAHTAHHAEEEECKYYAACGMNGYIHKGSVLMAALADGLQANAADPDKFFICNAAATV